MFHMLYYVFFSFQVLLVCKQNLFDVGVFFLLFNKIDRNKNKNVFLLIISLNMKCYFLFGKKPITHIHKNHPQTNTERQNHFSF